MSDANPNAAPQPTSDGSFLLVTHGPRDGDVKVARYATFNDANCIAVNWTGGDSQIYEIAREMKPKPPTWEEFIGTEEQWAEAAASLGGGAA